MSHDIETVPVQMHRVTLRTSQDVASLEDHLHGLVVLQHLHSGHLVRHSSYFWHIVSRPVIENRREIRKICRIYSTDVPAYKHETLN